MDAKMRWRWRWCMCRRTSLCLIRSLLSVSSPTLEESKWIWETLQQTPTNELIGLASVPDREASIG